MFDVTASKKEPAHKRKKKEVKTDASIKTFP